MKPPKVLRLEGKIEIPVPHQPSSGIWGVATADNDFDSVSVQTLLIWIRFCGKKVLRLEGQINIPVSHQPSSGIWCVGTADNDFGSGVTNFSDLARLGKK